MVSLNPRYVVAFAGSGVVERLVIQAKTKRISVVDRRAGRHQSQAFGADRRRAWLGAFVGGGVASLAFSATFRAPNRPQWERAC
jgi:hypothetical protein